MPKLNALQDLFEIVLRDVYDAEKQILHSTPKFIKRAGNPNLKTILEAHLKDTRDQVTRIERVFQLFDLKPKAKHCAGMEGILKEGVELMAMDGEAAVLDAACIAAMQMAKHYEITAYGTLAAWCRLLGQNGDALLLLEESEQEEKMADAELSELAKSQVNAEALTPGPVLVG